MENNNDNEAQRHNAQPLTMNKKNEKLKPKVSSNVVTQITRNSLLTDKIEPLVVVCLQYCF
jgi:hypothetical protein